MHAPKLKHSYTVDEYLERERAAEERSEYLDGQIYAMAGESLSHGRISSNLGGLFFAQLRGKPCESLSKDTKVRSGPTPFSGKSKIGMFSYPDFVIICGEPECHDAEQDVILNPTVIVEILSPSTEAFDRGEKYQRYQTWNSTLRDYLLVSQDRPEIEQFSRADKGEWAHQLHSGLDAEVVITSIQCALRLAEVYERVRFSDAPSR